MATQEKKQNRFRNSITLKLTIVVILSLILLIPSLMVKKLINERESRKNEATRDITSKWGAQQLLSGPILVVPYEKKTRYSDGTYSTKTKYFNIFPSELKIEGHLDTDSRYRGIYDVLIYTGTYKITGNFKPGDFSNWPDTYSSINWKKATLVLGVSDPKGISKIVHLNWNEMKEKFSPGAYNCNLVNSGIKADVFINQEETNTFSIDLTLNGSGSAFYTPLGNETEVSITSDCNNPSFDGSYITTDNNVTSEGFSARWLTNEMNRPYPQIITSDSYISTPDRQSFGVKLSLPVDTYQKSERSVKYSFLFIALTFLVIFFAEITGKKRVHPVQYLIVGLALIIFYSLLIALAEHIAFNLAYLIASLVIIGMIVAYAQALFKKWKNTATIGAFLVLLYVFLFTILQIADYALILGNIGLVIVLGLVMVYSRKVDWYENEDAEKTDNSGNHVSQ